MYSRSDPIENDDRMEMVYEGTGTAGEPEEEDREDSLGLAVPNHLVTQDESPHDEDELQFRKELRCTTERTSSCSHSDYLSDSLSSAGLSSSFQWVRCKDECAKYKLNDRSKIYRGKMKTFWESITREPSECLHVRNWYNFKKELNEKIQKIPVSTTEALKIIFNIQDKGDSQQLTVELDDLLLLSMCFGAFSSASGESPMLDYFHDVLANSSTKQKTTKTSWFAGKMSRQEAERRLSNQKEGTFLVRMSETEFGKFALSVVADKGATPVHTDLEFQEIEECDTSSGACSGTTTKRFIEIEGDRYDSLHSVVNGYFRMECFDDDHPGLICVRECPDLPFNRIVTGYKKLRK